MNFIIVLGSSNVKIRESRVRRAVEYFDTLKPIIDPDDPINVTQVATLIFCGKGSSVVGSTEAEAMRDYAVTIGAPRDRCMVETKSMTTIGNLQCALELLEYDGWFKTTYFNSPYTFTICTSKFHAKRALLAALYAMSKWGTVQIICDDDNGDDNRRSRECNLLNLYAEHIVDVCMPKIEKT